ncbi:MAG TPA: hypothetical protein VGQ57_19050 [Polyangiaceae bacterium]|nr:hypothetical protein [Polyangiaceae bacterium]
MRTLLLKSAGFLALASVVTYACSDPNRVYVDTHASGGTGGDGTGGTAGTLADGGTAGTAKGGKGGKGGSSGKGGSTGASGAGNGGESGDVSAGGSGARGGSGGKGGKGGTGGNAGDENTAGAGAGGEGGVIIPPEPGKPGYALVAGGVLMKSASYKLYSTTSEGQLPLRSSTSSYILHGSLVGTTQPGDAVP